MANEREPDDPLPADFAPEGFVEKHRVSDGEDWASVAAQYNVKVGDLIYFNFHTNVPEEVNWYLRRNTGCNVSNDGGRNWAFSSSADPGLVYIPPSQVIGRRPAILHIEHKLRGGPYRITTEQTASESDVLAWLWQGDPPEGTELKLVEQQPGYNKFDATGIHEAESKQLRLEAYESLSRAEPESYEDYVARLEMGEELLDSPVPHLIVDGEGVTFREVWENFDNWKGLQETDDGWFVWVGSDPAYYNSHTMSSKVIEMWEMPTDESVRRDIRWYVEQGKSLDQAVRNVMEDQWYQLKMVIIGVAAGGAGI